MTMRKTIKTQALEQLDLFVPPPRRPTWGLLPERVQVKVTELIAALLGEEQKQNANHPREQEAADE
jgi:hypothetical protein